MFVHSTFWINCFVFNIFYISRLILYDAIFVLSDSETSVIKVPLSGSILKSVKPMFQLPNYSLISFRLLRRFNVNITSKVFALKECRSVVFTVQFLHDTFARKIFTVPLPIVGLSLRIINSSSKPLTTNRAFICPFSFVVTHLVERVY